MSASVSRNSGYLYQITIIGVLFFIFGFVTWLNGTLIPFLKLACELDTMQALFVTFAFYISYFFLAIPSSQILKRTGFKNGMALGLLVMALGCLVFIPAANARAFPLFLTGLFVQGMGLALLQTASNPYISIIGPIESAAQRISIMGICNKVAGILSPLILSSIVLKNATAIEQQVLAATDAVQKAGLLDELAGRVVMPYVVMAVVLAALAVMIRQSALPEIDTTGEPADEGATVTSAGRKSIWEFPHLLLGALAIFFYVGAEVMAGDGIGIYGRSLGFGLDQTKYFTSFTLAAMLLGYVLSIALIPKYISQQNFLKYSAILGLALTALTYFASGSAAVTSVALLGLANAVMWPAIFPLAINGLGRFTQIGSALLIMGIAGGAILPQVYGLLEKSVGYQAAFQITMLPCYVYILYFAMAGHKLRNP
ncbi:MAG: sugar MFS transporter [Saprospirales bacterium]|jgi:FHS family L-fucose permease-like MFS transporter|nr:sugar MFS transporter [Saprospirales bacterium]MBK8921426.1 sugar MFS transporter [Saprospirales bacterium]